MPAAARGDPLKAGRVGHLTEEQQKILDKFRQELKDEGYFVPERHDDPTLLRFLRARKFDLAKAKFMIIEQEKWRKELGVDEFSKNFDFPERVEVAAIYPQFYHKTDKDGRPVYFEALGKINIKSLYKITTEDRLIKRLVYEYERFLNDRLPACSVVKGELIETSCTVMDLKGVGVSQFFQVKDYVSKASSVGQDRYPETMGKFYIINAPWGFSTAWNLIKGWLDEVTVAKIQILGSDYKKALLEQIPAENLPKDYGGACQCSGGCNLSDQGPWTDPAVVKKVEELQAEKKAKAANGSAPAPIQAKPADAPVTEGATVAA